MDPQDRQRGGTATPTAVTQEQKASFLSDFRALTEQARTIWGDDYESVIINALNQDDPHQYLDQQLTTGKVPGTSAA